MLVCQHSQDKFMFRMNSTPSPPMDAANAAAHSDLVCSGLTASSATVSGAATVHSLSASTLNMPMTGLATHFQVGNTARISFD